MKIAITGHTSGIGHAIATWFSQRNHDILGFSRQTGHDLMFPVSIKWITQDAAEADVLVNNAYHRIAQVDLLYAMYQQWRNTDKVILTIGSNTGTHRDVDAVYKRALDKAVTQLQNTTPCCRIMLLRPGPVETLNAQQYIAEIAGWMIEQPGLIKSLTVVP